MPVKRTIFILLIVTVVLLLGTSPSRAQDPERLKAAPTDPPNAPPQILRSKPAHIQVEIETKEFRGPLADGVEYEFWTFGSSVPGPFIRVRQGDTIELTLKNDPNSKFPHSIDLHSVTGPGGGAKATQTAPGMKTAFSWKAHKAMSHGPITDQTGRNPLLYRK